MPKYVSKAKNYRFTPSTAAGLRAGYNTAKAAINALRRVQKKTKRKSQPQRKLKAKKLAGVAGIRSTQGDLGVNNSKTIYVRTPKLKTGKLRFNQWQTYENASTFSYASSTGTVPGTNQLNRQKVFVLATFGTSGDLTVLQNIPYNVLVTNATFDAISPNYGTAQRAGWMGYQGVKGHFEFTNQEQANLIFSIYMCVCKKDDAIGTNPATAWDNALDETAGTARGAAQVDAYMPNCKPSGQYFKERWKIVAKRTYSLAAGITQKHYFSHVSNSLVSMSRLQGNNYLKDVTVSFLCTMRGTPVDYDAVQTHGPATLVGYAPSKIVGITTIKYTHKSAPLQEPKITYQNNTISGTAPTAVWELNDEDGKPVNIFAATNAA